MFQSISLQRNQNKIFRNFAKLMNKPKWDTPYKTTTINVGTQQFISWDEEGGYLITGDGEEKGILPINILLTALSTCASYDVVSILQKQKVELTNLQIEATGRREPNGEAPNPFKEIHVHFKCSGNNLNQKKLEKAVQLSAENYCGVYATLKGISDISFSVEII